MDSKQNQIKTMILNKNSDVAESHFNATRWLCESMLRCLVDQNPCKCVSVPDISIHNISKWVEIDTAIENSGKMRIYVYHFSHHFLHKLCAFFHLSARPTQLYNVTFLRWVREVDDDLKARGKKCYFSIKRTQMCDWKNTPCNLKHLPQGTYPELP